MLTRVPLADFLFRRPFGGEIWNRNLFITTKEGELITNGIS
jgi:hypothetical protein